ncbi:MAG: hypothetical protein JRF05_06585 [Deltaproteobacteria bacterium]|nr:hypothetical protein [Deltaproteobacteria bacterium]
MVSAEETAGVKMAEKETIGKYLADGTGMPLYQFVKDESGVSNFSGECLVK